MNASDASSAPARPAGSAEVGADVPASSRADAPGPSPSSEPAPAPARTIVVTLGWWLHGFVRVLLAVALTYYGVAKLVLGQFGVADMGDALVAQGEMSPMGMLWRLVAFSPLFQVLAGLAEAGAALALMWRRSVAFGALLAAADMAFVLVLNLGYDVPVKTIALVLLVMSLVVLSPWIPRVVRSLLGHGAIPAGPEPALIPGRPFRKVTDVAGPLAGIAVLCLVAWGVSALYPARSTDAAPPAGVWVVAQDTAEPAAQLSEDTRWQKAAFGEIAYDGTARAQVRRADGTLLDGTYERTGDSTVELALREQRDPGQTFAEHAASEQLTWTLAVQEQADGSLRLHGEGIDLVLSPDDDGRVLYDRGFSWELRPDDPFNR